MSGFLNFAIFRAQVGILRKEVLVSLFQKIGRASLEAGLQNSHSGNMACLWIDKRSHQFKVAITKSGSQKGDLKPEDILFFHRADKSVPQASSELVVHRAILNLDKVKASLHAHAKEIILLTLALAEKRKGKIYLFPFDPLGWVYLRSIPIIRVKKPYGSPELAQAVAQQLRQYPVVAVCGHGLFSRGQTLTEAFFYAQIADVSASIIRHVNLIKGRGDQQERLIAERRKNLFCPPPLYDPNWEKWDGSKRNQKKVLDKAELDELAKTRNRLFQARLSPFFTGSLSWKCKQKMIFVFPASTPEYIEIPLALHDSFSEATKEERYWHQLIYERTSALAVIRAFMLEAEVIAWDFVSPKDKIKYFQPIDVEGRVLHPRIPVLEPPVEAKNFIDLLKKYELVIIRGGGVWTLSPFSLSKALHHLSSLKDSLHYYLELKKMKMLGDESARKYCF